MTEESEFKECDNCRSKTGSPTLCEGCFSNRLTRGKMKPLIAVLHAAPHDDRSMLVTSILRKRGIPYKLYTETVWHGHAEKIKTALRASQELTDYKYILFLDAYDVIALAGPNEILERFQAFHHLFAHHNGGGDLHKDHVRPLWEGI